MKMQKQPDWPGLIIAAALIALALWRILSDEPIKVMATAPVLAAEAPAPKPLVDPQFA